MVDAYVRGPARRDDGSMLCRYLQCETRCSSSDIEKLFVYIVRIMCVLEYEVCLAWQRVTLFFRAVSGSEGTASCWKSATTPYLSTSYQVQVIVGRRQDKYD